MAKPLAHKRAQFVTAITSATNLGDGKRSDSMSCSVSFPVRKGMGAARLPRSLWLERSQTHERAQEMLCRALNLKTVVGFVGSGCSRPFNYPVWAQLPQEADKALKLAKPDQMNDDRSKASLPPGNELFALGEAQRRAKSDGVQRQFEEYFATIFRGSTDRLVSDFNEQNPYYHLFQLPIHRFVTSNYDMELEYWAAQANTEGAFGNVPSFRLGEPAFSWKKTKNGAHLVEWPIFRDRPDHPSARWERFQSRVEQGEASDEIVSWPASHTFTQLPEHSGFLADFVVARPSTGLPRIFHCHGRCDLPESMILSEEDYQRWYLNPTSKDNRAFLQTIELLLGSNPILFVGFSLRDDDLLRALRVLSIADARYKESRPLFALMDRCFARNPDREAEVYYERYGLHVLWYPDVESAKQCDLYTLATGIEDFCVGKGNDISGLSWGELKVAEANGSIDLRRLERPWAAKLLKNKSQTQEVRPAWVRFLSARLMDALARLKENWTNWQDAWWQKPKFKEIKVSNERVWIDHRPITPSYQGEQQGGPSGGSTNMLANTRVERDCSEIENLSGVGRVIVLLGPGGCGKSHRALHLAEGNFGKGFQAVFFWSSYYSDDWHSAVDRAVRFLRQFVNEQHSERPNGANTQKSKTVLDAAGSRIEQLRRILNETRSLLVFDGFERLLRPTEHPEVGRPYSSNVQAFLEVLRETEFKSTVILTSRLWPDELGSLAEAGSRGTGPSGNGQPENKHRPRAFHVGPLTSAEIMEDQPFGSLGENGTRVLCSLLNGHSFGLRLAQAHLLNADAQSPIDLRRALQRTPPDRRVSRMVKEALESYEAEQQGSNGGYNVRRIARGFVERLAVFMSPLDLGVAKLCFDEARGSVGSGTIHEASRGTANDFLAALHRRHLVIQSNDASDFKERWSMHPIVRSYVLHRLHGAKGEDLPNFSVPGFTTGTTPVDPGSSAAARMITELLEKIMEKAEVACDGKKASARFLCRAAFGLMRSRMEATTAARWCPYDKYIRYSLRLCNLVKELSKENGETPGWQAAERAEHIEGKESVLYAEELAWLYNEIGLICCCEGNMYDTLAVWEQGYEINKLVEDGASTGQFIVQSKLHLAHTFMEMGKINDAHQWLEETEAANHTLNNLDFQGRILGYKGLIAHLRGNLGDAKAYFVQTRRCLKEAGGNPRAESIFMRCEADLMIRLQEFERAEKLIRVARALAETSDHPDLVAYARKSFGHLLRSRGEFEAARDEYNAALDFAQEKGIRRLEADLLSELSRLALDQGDPETARRRALEGMRIANELGLGLRQCHGLVVLGLAALRAEQRDLAVGYLQVAYRLSRKDGYWLRAQEADEHLRRIGVVPTDQQRHF